MRNGLDFQTTKTTIRYTVIGVIIGHKKTEHMKIYCTSPTIPYSLLCSKKRGNCWQLIFNQIQSHNTQPLKYSDVILVAEIMLSEGVTKSYRPCYRIISLRNLLEEIQLYSSSYSDQTPLGALTFD